MGKRLAEYKELVIKAAIQATSDILHNKDIGSLVTTIRGKVELTGNPELDIVNLVACIKETLKVIPANWL